MEEIRVNYNKISIFHFINLIFMQIDQTENSDSVLI